MPKYTQHFACDSIHQFECDSIRLSVGVARDGIKNLKIISPINGAPISESISNCQANKGKNNVYIEIKTKKQVAKFLTLFERLKES